MELFDTHFHIYKDTNINEYLKTAKLANVKYFLSVCADFNDSFMARKFAESDANSYFSVGVHPHEASKFKDEITIFCEFRNHKKLVAIGEIGLDYFYEHSDRECQKELFSQFLKLALDWNLPAIIHCRDKDNQDDAYADTYKLLADFAKKGGRFVVHCYTGTSKWLKKFIDLGGYIGITGIVTFPKAHNVREILKDIPLNRLFIETDSPYLAPIPYRGKTNSSAYVVEVAKRLAQEYDIPVAELAKITTQNALDFFVNI